MQDDLNDLRAVMAKLPNDGTEPLEPANPRSEAS